MSSSARPVVSGIDVTPATSAGPAALVWRHAPDGAGAPPDEIWMVPLAGGDAKRVVRFPQGFASRNGNCGEPAFAPGGTRVAVVAALDLPARGAIGCRIVVIDLRSGNSAALAPDATPWDDLPAWSPDGTRVAFLRSGADRVQSSERQEVWIANADGSGARQLFIARRGVGYPLVWAPDGKTILTGGLRLLATLDVATTTWTDTPLHVDDLAVRAEHPQVAAVVAGTPRIEAFDVPVRERSLVVNATGVSLQLPRWRPGRDELLYLRQDRTTTMIGVAAVGGAERVLATTQGATCAEWTPDGASIVFCAVGARPWVSRSLRIVGADGQGERELWKLDPATDVTIATVFLPK
ncbi:MAG: PD40 domain-containing protein [Chloroflexi bacterium]|nr:PD40 domain-containing protein [Chloroflexota bacterium]